MNIATITEENCKQLVYDYGERNYQQGFAEASRLFPYDNEGLPADLKLKNVLEWYFYEWINPKTGKTIVREFAEKFSVPEPLRGKMLQMEKPFYSEFIVLSANQGERSMAIKDMKAGKEYNIVMAQSPDTYMVGRKLKGRIHGWGDAWRVAGIVGVSPSEEEIEGEMFARHGFVSPRMLMQRFEDGKMAEIDGVIIGAKTTVYGILDKYPAHWIDGICGRLGIERKGILKREKIWMILEKINQDTQAILTGLSDKEKECMEMIANAGGMIKYGKLGQFSDEMPYWWPEHGVNSTIGKLRAKGLLYVGRTMLKGRFYKMALMPRELVPKLL